jgi:hypothetical protein
MSLCLNRSDEGWFCRDTLEQIDVSTLLIEKYSDVSLPVGIGLRSHMGPPDIYVGHQCKRSRTSNSYW